MFKIKFNGYKIDITRYNHMVYYAYIKNKKGKEVGFVEFGKAPGFEAIIEEVRRVNEREGVKAPDYDKWYDRLTLGFWALFAFIVFYIAFKILTALKGV